MKRYIFFYLFIFRMLSGLFPEESVENQDTAPVETDVQPENERDYTEYLGMNLHSAYEIFGVPDEVFVYRGEKEEYDDVVFYFKKQHLYLFWFHNTVWVVRMDKEFKETVLGLSMDMPKQEVMETLSRPYKELEDSLIFFLKDRGYPVRLRLFFEDDKLTDIYIYRGDF